MGNIDIAKRSEVTRYLGAGTTLPALASSGDVYDHAGLGLLVWNLGAWTQYTTVRMTQAARIALTTSWESVIPAGYEVFETDTGRQLIWMSTTNKWRKCNGQWEKLASAVATGGTATNGATTAINTTTFSLPAGVCGPIKVQAGAMWTASNNAAAYVLLQTGGVEVARMRLHNQGSGYGIFQHCSLSGMGNLTTPGMATNVTVAWNVDSGGAAMTVNMAYVEAWF